MVSEVIQVQRAERGCFVRHYRDRCRETTFPAQRTHSMGTRPSLEDSKPPAANLIGYLGIRVCGMLVFFVPPPLIWGLCFSWQIKNPGNQPTSPLAGAVVAAPAAGLHYEFRPESPRLRSQRAPQREPEAGRLVA